MTETFAGCAYFAPLGPAGHKSITQQWADWVKIGFSSRELISKVSQFSNEYEQDPLCRMTCRYVPHQGTTFGCPSVRPFLTSPSSFSNQHTFSLNWINQYVFILIPSHIACFLTPFYNVSSTYISNKRFSPILKR